MAEPPPYCVVVSDECHGKQFTHVGSDDSTSVLQRKHMRRVSLGDAHPDDLQLVILQFETDNLAGHLVDGVKDLASKGWNLGCFDPCWRGADGGAGHAGESLGLWVERDEGNRGGVRTDEELEIGRHDG
jgi:hypothetical protein